MGWRFVKQPNGLYARFSSYMDDFTDYNMTPKGILRIGPENWDIGHWTLREKIGEADRSPEWFEEDIENIRLVHGKEIADERRDLLSRETLKSKICGLEIKLKQEGYKRATK